MFSSECWLEIHIIGKKGRRKERGRERRREEEGGQEGVREEGERVF